MPPTILDMYLSLKYRQKMYSRAPITKSAAQSMKLPPNTAQNPAAPKAEPAICSQAGLGLPAFIRSSSSLACSKVYLPAAMSKLNLFTATTLDSCIALIGMNSTLAYLPGELVVKIPLLSTKKLPVSTP